jgi:hypothetical protein
MNCQRIQESFVDYQAGSLSAAENAAVREHLKSCLECQREWSGLQEVMTKLGQLPPERPSPRLRANFYAMLDSHLQSESVASHSPFAGGRNRLDRFLASLLPSRPLFQAAFAAAALALGLFVGSRGTAPSSGATEPSAEATRAQIAELQRKVDSMTNLVAVSLSRHESANERLQNVVTSLQGGPADEQTLAKLLRTVAFDPSTNVRLSALEALYSHADRSVVRKGVLASLPRESSPLVQLAMIDFLAAAGDTDAAPALQTLTRSAQVDTSVRTAAQRALSQF